MKEKIKEELEFILEELGDVEHDLSRTQSDLHSSLNAMWDDKATLDEWANRFDCIDTMHDEVDSAVKSIAAATNNIKNAIKTIEKHGVDTP